jgi:hypothetical protein
LFFEFFDIQDIQKEVVDTEEPVEDQVEHDQIDPVEHDNLVETNEQKQVEAIDKMDPPHTDIVQPRVEDNLDQAKHVNNDNIRIEKVKNVLITLRQILDELLKEL